MKNISYSLLRCISALLLGLILVIWPGAAVEYLIIVLGALFVIPSLLAITFYYRNHNLQRNNTTLVPSVGGLLFGGLLMIMPGFFANFVMFMLGVVLVMGGIHQIVNLTLAKNWVRVPASSYIMPCLILVVGLISLFNPSEVRETTILIIGIGILVYAVNEFFEWLLFNRKNPKYKNIVQAEDDDIEDADILE